MDIRDQWRGYTRDLFWCYLSTKRYKGSCGRLYCSLPIVIVTLATNKVAKGLYTNEMVPFFNQFVEIDRMLVIRSFVTCEY